MRKLKSNDIGLKRDKGFFEIHCSDITAGKERCIEEVHKKFGTTKISGFYSAVGECLETIGFSKVQVTRDGDTNNRMDALIVDSHRSIPIEIKSPKEVEYVNIKSIRQALENKIVLLSRKWYPTDRKTSTLSIGFNYPNDRSEVDNLIEDFQRVFNINVGIVDFKTLLRMRWDIEIEKKQIDLEKIYNLKGAL